MVGCVDLERLVGWGAGRWGHPAADRPSIHLINPSVDQLAPSVDRTTPSPPTPPKPQNTTTQHNRQRGHTSPPPPTQPHHTHPPPQETPLPIHNQPTNQPTTTDQTPQHNRQRARTSPLLPASSRNWTSSWQNSNGTCSAGATSRRTRSTRCVCGWGLIGWYIYIIDICREREREGTCICM
jgi:hypothetical protein